MEGPAQGASADAQPSQGPGFKQESPGLPRELELSPEATKRPLEPTLDYENGDAKRLKMDGEQPQDDETGMGMDLDLDAMVQNVLGDIDVQMTRFGELDHAPNTETAAETATAEATAAGSVEPPLQEPDEPPVTFLSNPSKAMRVASLPSLANFGLQVILILSQQPWDRLAAAIKDTESESGLSWTALKSLFTQTRLLYSKESPVARQDDLGLAGVADELRIANLASLCCSLTSSGRDADSTDRLELYNNFFAILLRDGAVVSSGIAELFVAAKTQAVIDSVARGVQEKPIDRVIEEAFPADLEEILKRRHDGTDLTAIEGALVSSAQQRKDALFSHIAGGQDENQLRSTYKDQELIRLLNIYLVTELSSYTDVAAKYGIRLPQRAVSELEEIGDHEMNSHEINDREMHDHEMHDHEMHDHEMHDHDVSEMDEQALESLLEATNGLVQQYLPNGGIEDVAEPAVPTTEGSVPPTDEGANRADADASHSASTAVPETNGTAEQAKSDQHDLLAEIEQQTQEYVRTTLSNLSPAPYQPTVPQPTGATISHAPYLSHLQQAHQNQSQSQNQNQNHQHPPPPPPSHFYGYPPPNHSEGMGSEEIGPLPPSQSLPSAVLYDRARQAALSKNTNPQRREGGSSTRRPWSQEEEKALMTGLDKVQGPHWSQILSLYGPEGTVSNILKDRSQVQLKDKARNLKLFFLKSNSEMPYYLQAVTGELKTRAPGQAARKEAEEKARQNSEEAQSRGQQSMPMQPGLHSSPHSQQRPSPAGINHHGLQALQAATQSTPTPIASAAQMPASTQAQPSSQPGPGPLAALAAAINPVKTEPGQSGGVQIAPAPPAPTPATTAATTATIATTAPAVSASTPTTTTTSHAPTAPILPASFPSPVPQASQIQPSQGPGAPILPASFPSPARQHNVAQASQAQQSRPQTPATHTHTPTPVYTPTQAGTPTQPPPIPSPQVKAENTIEQHAPTPTATVSEPTQQIPSALDNINNDNGATADPPSTAPTEPTYNPFGESDDLKEAALMQSLRELEAYSGATMS